MIVQKRFFHSTKRSIVNDQRLAQDDKEEGSEEGGEEEGGEEEGGEEEGGEEEGGEEEGGEEVTMAI
jgi:hypothetical protein